MSPIVKIGHGALRTRLPNLSKAWIKRPATKLLVKRMFREMRRSKGVGLAANQLGLPYRLFVMQCEDNPRYPGHEKVLPGVFFNPHIVLRSSKTVSDWEGCLSIPKYRGITPRSESVVLEAMLSDGKKIRVPFEGFAARIIQHETDHLDGLFYVDRMKDLGMWMHEDEMA
jgi:peptide deformylase